MKLEVTYVLAHILSQCTTLGRIALPAFTHTTTHTTTHTPTHTPTHPHTHTQPHLHSAYVVEGTLMCVHVFTFAGLKKQRILEPLDLVLLIYVGVTHLRWCYSFTLVLK